MIVGVIRTGFIAKNDNRLDPQYYLGGPTAVRTFKESAERHRRQAIEAEANAAKIQKHVDALAATGEVTVLHDDGIAKRDTRAAWFLAGNVKKTPHG